MILYFVIREKIGFIFSRGAHMQSSNVLRWLAGASLVLAALACTLSPSASTPADNPKSSPSTAPTSAETKQSQAPTLTSTQADLNPPPAQPSAASAEASASVSFLHGTSIQLDNSHGDHITLIIPPVGSLAHRHDHANCPGYPARESHCIELLSGNPPGASRLILAPPCSPFREPEPAPAKSCSHPFLSQPI